MRLFAMRYRFPLSDPNAEVKVRRFVMAKSAKEAVQLYGVDNPTLEAEEAGEAEIKAFWKRWHRRGVEDPRDVFALGDEKAKTRKKAAAAAPDEADIETEAMAVPPPQPQEEERSWKRRGGLPPARTEAQREWRRASHSLHEALSVLQGARRRDGLRWSLPDPVLLAAYREAGEAAKLAFARVLEEEGYGRRDRQRPPAHGRPVGAEPARPVRRQRGGVLIHRPLGDAPEGHAAAAHRHVRRPPFGLGGNRNREATLGLMGHIPA
jgi:hypothetical protein